MGERPTGFAQPTQRGYRGREGIFDVPGISKGQPSKATVISLGANHFEPLGKPPAYGVADSVEETEIAGLTNRMVHYVSFLDALDEGSMLVHEMEKFQHQCWNQERAKDGIINGQKSNKGTSSKDSGSRRSKSKSSRRTQSPELSLAEAMSLHTTVKRAHSSVHTSSSTSSVQDIRRARSSSVDVNNAAKARLKLRPGVEQGQSVTSVIPSSLDEEMYLDHIQMSFHHGNPHTGLAMGPGVVRYPKKSETSALLDESFGERVSSNFGALLNSSYLHEPRSEVFLKKLADLQFLCNDTIRLEKKATKRPVDPSVTDSTFQLRGQQGTLPSLEFALPYGAPSTG